MTPEFHLEDTNTACHHYESESRVKLDSLGNPHFVLQCVDCGKRMSKDISAKNFTPAQLESMPKWDLELQKKFHAAAQIAWYEQKDPTEGIGKLKDYETHLLSQKWKEMCERVMDRANRTCEGCRLKPAVMVHHLTFKRFGDEMLFDLVAICDDCRSKLHSGITPPRTEDPSVPNL